MDDVSLIAHWLVWRPGGAMTDDRAIVVWSEDDLREYQKRGWLIKGPFTADAWRDMTADRDSWRILADLRAEKAELQFERLSRQLAGAARENTKLREALKHAAHILNRAGSLRESQIVLDMLYRRKK